MIGGPTPIFGNTHLLTSSNSSLDFPRAMFIQTQLPGQQKGSGTSTFSKGNPPKMASRFLDLFFFGVFF